VTPHCSQLQKNKFSHKRLVCQNSRQKGGGLLPKIDGPNMLNGSMNLERKRVSTSCFLFGFDPEYEAWNLVDYETAACPAPLVLR